LLVDAGVLQVSLADTVGLATPALVRDVFGCVVGVHAGLEIGVHLHATSDDVSGKIRAAYEAGCRRFDSAIGGLGGCPFAQDALVGNIPTEVLLATLTDLGAELPDLRPLDGITAAAVHIERQFGEVVQ
ncbi:MAG: hydroxymethylglutaryl-CoA lyase, partial [Bryocella sp.]